MRRFFAATACAFLLGGCGAINEFSRRSELTLRLVTAKPIAEGKERSTEAELVLHGNNRDILAAYKSALEFTLMQVMRMK